MISGVKFIIKVRRGYNEHILAKLVILDHKSPGPVPRCSLQPSFTIKILATFHMILVIKPVNLVIFQFHLVMIKLLGCLQFLVIGQ